MKPNNFSGLVSVLDTFKYILTEITRDQVTPACLPWGANALEHQTRIFFQEVGGIFFGGKNNLHLTGIN